MVQCLLRDLRAVEPVRVVKSSGLALPLLVLVLLLTPAFASKRESGPPAAAPPDLLLPQGRKLTFERAYSSDVDVRSKPGFWGKIVNAVAGKPDRKELVRPYGVAVDSRGRMIVTDPGQNGIHIFDPVRGKYKFIDRFDKYKDPMFEPQCVTVDKKDNIYVTDSKAGKVFLFDADGKYRGVFGSLKGGEGFFKRPTGIAVDPDTQEVYITDTLRDRVYVVDQSGKVLRTIGEHGSGPGQFNYPTELLIRNGVLAVVDSMNFRVQMFETSGKLLGTIGDVGDAVGTVFRPKGIAIDSENHIYLVEGLWGVVQVFDREGVLLYIIGDRPGTRLGQFQLPTGLFIDRDDRVYVVDTYNQRVQVFHYYAAKSSATKEGKP